MIKYIIALISLMTLLSVSAFGQQNFYKYRLGVTGGTMLYYGDLTDDYPRIKHYTEWAKGLTLDKSLSRFTSLRLAVSKGQIRYNDRTRNWSGDFVDNNPNFDRGLNFETDISDASFSFVFHSDNNKTLDDRAFFSPYLTVGIGVTSFDVYGDLLDSNGEAYNFEANPELEQDEDFETNLRDLDIERADYNEKVLHIPVGFGLKFRLSNRLNLNLETNIKYTFTDYLDDVDSRGKDNGWNDIYAYTHASLSYNFGYKEKSYRPSVIVTAPQAYATDATNINDLLALEVMNDTVPSQTADVPLSKREQKLEEKRLKKEQKLAAKEAKKRCKTACKDLPKEEQSACKTNCNLEENYAAYLNVVEEENKQVELFVDSLESTYTSTDQYQENIDSLQQIIETEQKERVESGTSTIETPDVVDEINATPPMENTTSTTTKTVKEEVIIVEEGMEGEKEILVEKEIDMLPPMATQNTALLQSILQMQQQIMALQQQLGQLSQKPATSYDPVVEMYKLEADKLRQESMESKLIGEMQLLRKEIEQLKGNTPPSTTKNSDNRNATNHSSTAISSPSAATIKKAETEVVKASKTTNEETKATQNAEITEMQKQLEALQKQNGDLLKEVSKQNEQLIKAERKAAKKRRKATEDLTDTIKEINRQEEIKEEINEKKQQQENNEDENH